VKKSKIIALAIFLLLLVACGGRSQRNTEVVNEAINVASENIFIEGAELTLRIMAPELYTTAINAAARDMARILRRQEIEFGIELTTYEPAEKYNQRTRLQVMLMAGQGYDLFFWDGHPLRSYVANGFLTNFYPLIDNSPNTEREDFFTNVLEAYEYEGGLFVFPLSFGFEYIGINTGLPESIINSFVGRESITMLEMLQMHNT